MADQVPGQPPTPEALTTYHVRRAVDGDGDSLAWLVSRLSPLLLAQASYRLGPVLRELYDPEDLVQDAWMVALPWLTTMPARDGRHTPVLLKFLGTTMVNRIQNLTRKHIVGKPARRSGRYTGSLPERDPLDQLSAQQSGAITQAIRRERRNTVTTCLDTLAAKDREVIVLRGIEQLSVRTVGVMLEISPEAVAMRYHRALKALRAQLPGSVFDEMHEDEGEDH